jgi:hypothetical protein
VYLLWDSAPILARSTSVPYVIYWSYKCTNAVCSSTDVPNVMYR